MGKQSQLRTRLVQVFSNLFRLGSKSGWSLTKILKVCSNGVRLQFSKSKMFWDQNCDVQKNLGPIFFKNKNCVPIILGLKDKVRKQKKMVQKNFGQKKCWIKKVLVLWFQKVLGLEKFWVWVSNVFGLKNFVSRKFGFGKCWFPKNVFHMRLLVPIFFLNN